MKEQLARIYWKHRITGKMGESPFCFPLEVAERKCKILNATFPFGMHVAVPIKRCPDYLIWQPEWKWPDTLYRLKELRL